MSVDPVFNQQPQPVKIVYNISFQYRFCKIFCIYFAKKVKVQVWSEFYAVCEDNKNFLDPVRCDTSNTSNGFE